MRPITLFTGQWADLPFEEVCRLASEWGYDGLEIACWGDHFEVDKAVADEAYVERRLDMLAKHNLRVWAISNHLVGRPSATIRLTSGIRESCRPDLG